MTHFITLQRLTPDLLNLMEERDRLMMDICYRIVSEYAGCMSPAEELLRCLMRGYASPEGLTPELAIEAMDDFRVNFGLASGIAFKMFRDYAHLKEASECPS